MPDLINVLANDPLLMDAALEQSGFSFGQLIPPERVSFLVGTGIFSKLRLSNFTLLGFFADWFQFIKKTNKHKYLESLGTQIHFNRVKKKKKSNIKHHSLSLSQYGSSEQLGLTVKVSYFINGINSIVFHGVPKKTKDV